MSLGVAAEAISLHESPQAVASVVSAENSGKRTHLVGWVRRLAEMNFHYRQSILARNNVAEWVEVAVVARFLFPGLAIIPRARCMFM